MLLSTIIPIYNKERVLNRTLQMSIPLSEQTIQISMDTDKINNNGMLFAKGNISINNPLLFLLMAEY